MIKTSKIQEIHKMSPWEGPNGTIVYHHLLMENGDLIDIGKKKECKVGWELTYRIVDTQHKYNKAKAEQPQPGTPAAQNIQTNIQNKDDREKKIAIGHAINNATQIVMAQMTLDTSSVWTKEALRTNIKDRAKLILDIGLELFDEEFGEPKQTPKPQLELTPEQPEDDLPF